MDEGGRFSCRGSGDGEDAGDATAEFSNSGYICLCNLQVIIFYHDPVEETFCVGVPWHRVTYIRGKEASRLA